MRTITVDEHIEIERPAPEVWALVADYRRDPEWRTGVVTMDHQPAGVVRAGTTTAEVLRFGGRTWHNDGVVTDVDAGRWFGWRTVQGADAHGSREVEPLDPGRCRVRLHMVVRPAGAERLLRPVLGRMLRRNLIGDLGRLRSLVEAGRPAVA